MHKTPIQPDPDLEDIDFIKSDLIEELLLGIGTELQKALMKTERYDDTAIVSDLIGAFTYAAGSYGEKTNRWPEFLGTSLNEAALMKLGDLQKNGKLTNREWWYFAEDGRTTIAEAVEKRNRGE